MSSRPVKVWVRQMPACGTGEPGSFMRTLACSLACEGIQTVTDHCENDVSVALARLVKEGAVAGQERTLAGGPERLGNNARH